jgi:hypothetical protein
MKSHSRIRRSLGIILLLALAAFSPASAAASSMADPIRLDPGPQLFIDEHLIAEQTFLSRTVNQPAKRPEPVITAKGGDYNHQPYLTVLRDPDTGRFRVWYNTPVTYGRSHLAYMESTDGIHWIRPFRLLQDPSWINYGASVIDRGRDFKPAGERYAFAFWHGGGTRIAVSPDGLDWRMLSPDPVWLHNHDITSLRWDPVRKHYFLIGTVKTPGPLWKGEEEGQRIPHQTVSKDLLTWEEKWPIILPKSCAPIEQGETQFYSMSGVITRGELMIGLVKVLRDDLNATPGKTAAEMGDLKRKAAGLGYTVLAWTRDGRHWQRDHEPFLPNDPDPARWDHAMAWGDDQILVGDETYIYYGGYQFGHKAARYEARQLGLARMPRDRYVAREADLNPGRLVTRSLSFNAGTLSVNARVVGAMRVRLLDASGQPLADYGWVELKGDSVKHPVSWPKGIAALGGKAVRLEFELTHSQLFGFQLD